MGIFSRVSEAEKQRPAVSQAEKTGGITFDPDLVNRLKREHMELVRIFNAIKSAAAECHFKQLPDLLAEFKHAFLNHVGSENVKIYVYLQQHWEMDEETLSFVSGVRKEMNEIARAVMKFVDTYIAALPSPVGVIAFNAELDKVGAALFKRVEMEESRLYSLYRP